MPAKKKWPYPPYDMVECAVLSYYQEARRCLARECKRAQGALKVVPDLRRTNDPRWTAAKTRLESLDANLDRTKKENKRRLVLLLYGLRLRLCHGERKAHHWAGAPLGISDDATKKYIQRQGGRAEAKKLAALVLQPLTDRPGLVLRANPFSVKPTPPPKPLTIHEVIERRERAALGLK